tara:strand:- start:712 stop:1194 length:483 start_codon:yes stop_codon:yes gene_type:complete
MNKQITNLETSLLKSSATVKNSERIKGFAKSGLPSFKVKKGITLLRVEYPFATLQEIGENFGVSRQYVYKVLTNAGVPTLRAKRQKYTVCKVCDERIEESMSKTHMGKCHGEYYFLSVHCTNCNKSWSMRRGVYLQKLRRGDRYIYCSRPCYFKDRFYAD